MLCTFVRDGVQIVVMQRDTGDGFYIIPDVVWLELQQPQITGLKFRDAIRADVVQHKSLVFVLTTSNDSKDKLAAYSYCVTGYITGSSYGVACRSLIPGLGIYAEIAEFPICVEKLPLMNVPVETPKILLIEDDSVFRLLIKRLLGTDYQIDEAASIESGRSLLNSGRFQCVLLDYRLPDGTGFQVLPDAIERELPVVMMTAMGHEQLAIDAIKQGCQDYLIKDDLTRATLCRSLANAMRHVQADRQSMRHRQTLQRVIQVAAAQCRQTTAAIRQVYAEGTADIDAKAPYLDQLDHLMDGLTAYSRLASTSWQAEPVPLHEVLEEVLHELKNRTTDLEIEVADQTATTFKSDREAIRFICRGLLDFLLEDGTPAATWAVNSEIDQGQILLSFVPKTKSLEELQAQLSSRVALAADEAVCTGIEIIRLLVEQLQGTIWAEAQGELVQIRVDLPSGNQLDGLPIT